MIEIVKIENRVRVLAFGKSSVFIGIPTWSMLTNVFTQTQATKIEHKLHELNNINGISFRDRYEGDFTLDGINAEDIKIIDFKGSPLLDIDDSINEKKHVDRIELMMFLYADIVENKEKVSDILFEDLITRFKMATSYNPRRIEKDIDAVIDFMKTDVWVDLYGKTYDDFTLTN